MILLMQIFVRNILFQLNIKCTFLTQNKISPGKISTHQTPPWKISPKNSHPENSPGIFPPISLIVFLNSFFTKYFVHKWGERKGRDGGGRGFGRGENVHVHPPWMICPERLNVPTWVKIAIISVNYRCVATDFHHFLSFEK